MINSFAAGAGGAAVDRPTAWKSVSACARVAVAITATTAYPQDGFFDPEAGYPEYPWPSSISKSRNGVYAAVRQSLSMLGLDAERFGTPGWNPLSGIVKPGDLVLLKPNLVRECREGRPDEWEQIVTSASVVRAVIDYVIIALAGIGRIVVADSPQTDSDFELTVERTGLKGMLHEISRRANVSIDLLDLRSERWIVRDGICVGSQPLRGDPLGVIRIDLGKRSRFCDSASRARFYGASYDSDETNHYHSGGRHVYELCGTALAADAIICIPKLKTHKKCGMTGCLKGMVGLAGNKNLLPHYRVGSPSRYGDQFPEDRRSGRLEGAVVRCAKRMLSRRSRVAIALAGWLKPIGYSLFGSTHNVIRSGNWHGNDTIWRTVLDLAFLLAFADREGCLQETSHRRFFCVVDGIVGGDGNGPLDADVRASGLVIAGESPLAVDAVSARIVGFSPDAIPLLRNGFSADIGLAPCLQSQVEVALDGREEVFKGIDSIPTLVGYRPHFGWAGRI